MKNNSTEVITMQGTTPERKPYVSTEVERLEKYVGELRDSIEALEQRLFEVLIQEDNEPVEKVLEDERAENVVLSKKLSKIVEDVCFCTGMINDIVRRCEL